MERLTKLKKFTFQYGSINTVCVITAVIGAIVFTFQYGSINTGNAGMSVAMTGEFTFQYGSINTRLPQIPF